MLPLDLEVLEGVPCCPRVGVLLLVKFLDTKDLDVVAISDWALSARELVTRLLLLENLLSSSFVLREFADMTTDRP